MPYNICYDWNEKFLDVPYKQKTNLDPSNKMWNIPEEKALPLPVQE